MKNCAAIKETQLWQREKIRKGKIQQHVGKKQQLVNEAIAASNWYLKLGRRSSNFPVAFLY